MRGWGFDGCWDLEEEVLRRLGNLGLVQRVKLNNRAVRNL